MIRVSMIFGLMVNGCQRPSVDRSRGALTKIENLNSATGVVDSFHFFLYIIVPGKRKLERSEMSCTQVVEEPTEQEQIP